MSYRSNELSDFDSYEQQIKDDVENIQNKSSSLDHEPRRHDSYQSDADSVTDINSLTQDVLAAPARRSFVYVPVSRVTDVCGAVSHALHCELCSAFLGFVAAVTVQQSHEVTDVIRQLIQHANMVQKVTVPL